MKTTLLVTAALAAVTLLPGQARSQNTPNTVTLAAAPSLLTFGATTVLSGQVTGTDNAGVRVELELDTFPFDGAKNAGMNVSTDASGNYSFTVKPELLTRYTVSAKAKPQVSSPAVDVRVRTAITLAVNDASARRGQRVTFSGAVSPVHAGTVLLQRRVGTGSFRTIARPALVDSAYTLRVRVRRTAVYRVRMAADADHARGTSPKRKVRVR